MADAAPTEAPEEPKVKKTQLARDVAFKVLKTKKKGEAMKMADIVEAVLADPEVAAADVSKSTISVQVSREAAEENGRFIRTDRSTYALR